MEVTQETQANTQTEQPNAEVKVEKPKRESPVRRHGYVVMKLKDYIEDGRNFEDGTKSATEIAREIGISPNTVSKNIQIMFYRKEFSSKVLVTIKPRMISVYTRKI